MDVLYHITDDARWETAVTHLAQAVGDRGLLILSDAFSPMERLAEHNVMRRSRATGRCSMRAGLQLAGLHPTHVLLNRPLGPFRFAEPHAAAAAGRRPPPAVGWDWAVGPPTTRSSSPGAEVGVTACRD